MAVTFGAVPDKVVPLFCSQRRMRLAGDGVDDCGIVAGVGLVGAATLNEMLLTPAGRIPSEARIVGMAVAMRDTLPARKQTGALFQEDVSKAIKNYFGLDIPVRKSPVETWWADIGNGFAWSTAGNASNVRNAKCPLKRTSTGHQVLFFRLNKARTRVAVLDPFRLPYKVEWVDKADAIQFVLGAASQAMGLRAKFGSMRRQAIVRQNLEKKIANLKTQQQAKIKGLKDAYEETIMELEEQLEDLSVGDRFGAGFEAAKAQAIASLRAMKVGG